MSRDPMIHLALLLLLLPACAAPRAPNLRERADGGRPIVVRDDAGAPLAPIEGDAAAPLDPPVDPPVDVLEDAGAPPSTPQPPGSRCNCDADCEGDATHAAVCVYGVCMTRATRACSSSGSRAECGDGSRCWRVRDTDEHVCWPDCDAFECAGTCDSDGSCVGRGALDCDPACGGFCVGACSPTNPGGRCPEGTICQDGACTDAPTCPPWECTGTDCTERILLPGDTDPTSAESLRRGYYIDTRVRYAWLRRDLVMLLQHATCEVARRFPGTAPLGIQDLSQMDGYTPGTDVGDPRHPTTTHRGSDLDLSYYQTDGDNDSHIVCGDGSDTNWNGTPGRYNDGYFCTTERNIVDWPREAYFFAMLGTSPLVRIFGVDTTFVDDLRAELDRQRGLGWITSAQHERANDLGWGAAGGWQFHHHHSHMSFLRP